jgi:hypothetical protein
MIHEGDAQVLPVHLMAGRARWHRPSTRHYGWKNEGIEVIDPLDEMITDRFDSEGE